MLHTQLHGTHWQIGFQLGAGLARDGHFILDAVPFPITPARLEFARTCLPLCRRWFPAALEELRGLAQGQGCAPDELAGVLFSMYAMPPGPCCSCFALRRGRGALFGRNSDFLTELEEHNANCLYRFSDGGYSFVGNTTSFLQMEDGVNQFGLAAGLTSVPPNPPRPGLNAGLTLRLLLESCRDVPFGNKSHESLQDAWVFFIFRNFGGANSNNFPADRKATHRCILQIPGGLML